MIQNNTTRLSLAIALPALLLVACAAQKPLFTPVDLANAERTGTLSNLYNQGKASLIGKDRAKKSQAPLFAQLDAVGSKLAGELNTKLRKQLESARLPAGLVPMSTLSEIRAAAEPMRTWEQPRHEAMLKDIEREMTGTQKAIDEVEAKLAALPERAQGAQREALASLEQLTGDTRYGEQRNVMLSRLRAKYEEAIATDQFDQALALLEELPVDENTARTRLELQTRLFERRFNESLAEDKPNEAYDLFTTLADSPNFDSVKERIGPVGMDMANYFVALGTDALAGGNVTDAWRWFSQARNVRIKLTGNAETTVEEKPLIDRLQRGYDAAKADKAWGVALGYLFAIQELSPYHPTLARDLNTTSEEVNRKAIRSGRIAPFASASGSVDYSGAIATGVTEYLFQRIPEDLRIISGDTQGITVDYIISGSINEARIETNEQKTRKTMRVVTEKDVMRPNPKHEEWLKLSERDRKRTPQPPAHIPFDKQEDISFNVTQLRKVGYYSVAFRLVRAETGEVLYTDSLTLKRELADEGNEGVDLGHFKLAAKAASLPPDIEILNQLTIEASKEIGQRLAVKAGGLERHYADEGKAAAANGNAILAAERYAASVMVGRRKQVDINEELVALKHAAAASGYAR